LKKLTTEVDRQRAEKKTVAGGAMIKLKIGVADARLYLNSSPIATIFLLPEQCPVPY
jgi:hypothetical protein